MIEYITYKKEKYPIRISYIALNGFKKDTDIKFTEMAGDMDLENYESLLFHSLVSGAAAMDSKMVFTKKDIPYVLDECMMEFIGLIPKFFPDNEAGKLVGKQQPNRAQRRMKSKA